MRKGLIIDKDRGAIEGKGGNKAKKLLIMAGAFSGGAPLFRFFEAYDH